MLSLHVADLDYFAAYSKLPTVECRSSVYNVFKSGKTVIIKTVSKQAGSYSWDSFSPFHSCQSKLCPTKSSGLFCKKTMSTMALHSSAKVLELSALTTTDVRKRTYCTSGGTNCIPLLLSTQKKLQAFSEKGPSEGSPPPFFCPYVN